MKSSLQKIIYLCRLVLRFLAFLSGMLTKLYINAWFQNSDFVFEQLKPGINFVRHAAKKVTKPRKSRRPKIYNFLFGRLAMSPKLRIIKSEKRWQRNKSATKVKSTIYALFPWRRGYYGVSALIAFFKEKKSTGPYFSRVAWKA